MHHRKPRSTSSNLDQITLSAVHDAALGAVNSVITAAIDTWDIAPRVRRLAMPAYLYATEDFKHLRFVGAWRSDTLLGFVSCEPAGPGEAPDGESAMRLHGLYVDPRMHGKGVGSRLVDAAKELSRTAGFTGLLVRAERNATVFFEKQGFGYLPAAKRDRTYPHLLWTDTGDRFSPDIVGYVSGAGCPRSE